MPINREQLEIGDIFLKRINREQLKDVPFKSRIIQEGISFFEWMLSRSPEFYHVGMFYDKFVAFETNPPCSKKFNISLLDEDFDKGRICIMRNMKLSVNGQINVQKWIDNHIGLPYGLITVGYEQFLGTEERFGLTKFVDWLRSKESPFDWKHEPICSQIIALALTAGDLDIRVGKRGLGQIIPGDYFTMPDFKVIQDMKI